MTTSSAQLGDIAEINPRLSAIPNGPVSFLGMADIREDGTTSSGVDREFSEVRKGYTPFVDGDILLAKITPCFQNGKIAQAKLHNRQGMGSTEFHVIRGDRQIVDQRYLLHFLRRKEFLVDGERRMTGSGGQRRVPVDFVKALEVPLPSLPEQRRIAAILDHADALRTRRAVSAIRVQELATSAFLNMFGDPAPSWPRMTIADVASSSKGAIRTGPFGSQLLHDEFTDAGVPVLGIDNAVENRFKWGKPRFITYDKYDQLKRYTVYPGDVLITIMGTNGRCAIVPDDTPVAINTKHLCCITPDASIVQSAFLHSYFLHHPVARNYLARTVKGAIMAGLNMGIIKSMPIQVPPLEMQAEFATLTASLAGHEKVLASSSSELDSLFGSLQSRAFRGEL
ncbi:restriction endonuclease subunit S [Gordonia sp. AC31]|uniref:restriction endonuclease subunit S n=1 Tax=Gordonia sp. AC31 TaxID=2962571 RepID=UPI002880FB5F|nr:restriction endonuclease subunit S [Gordonia sp. AC31]MDT0221490.1 restriction endonuclease subunit S [Gordonia sp. AC31]